ncbi:hypothetical protein EV424DRAFT_1324185, partial [Suillus variegatus]
WASGIMSDVYMQEIVDLSAKKHGSHFAVSHTSVEQLEEFNMDLLGRGMQRLAPKLWGLLDKLLFAGKKSVGVAVSTKGPEDSDEDDVYWEAFGDRELDGSMGVSADASARQEKITARHNKLKKVVIFSIIMQTANQKSNMFQSIFGIFLQSAHAPQKVIETLSWMGICVSIDSINTAVMSLSKEAHRGISALGRTLLASYAYNNFDVDLKSTVHTVDKSEHTLKHLTAGLLFPLQHGTTLDNLHCSKALWERLLLNPQVDSMDTATKKGWKDLLTIHPDHLNEAGLSRRDRFNSWKILSDLIEYDNGPTYFHQFKDRLGHLESVEMIPVAKTKILASRAMDISNSTVSGNINSVLELLKQGDIEDPAECDPLQGLDVSEYVTLFHGDLGTGE